MTTCNQVLGDSVGWSVFVFKDGSHTALAFDLILTIVLANLLIVKSCKINVIFEYSDLEKSV